MDLDGTKMNRMNQSMNSFQKLKTLTLNYRSVMVSRAKMKSVLSIRSRKNAKENFDVTAFTLQQDCKLSHSENNRREGNQ